MRWEGVTRQPLSPRVTSPVPRRHIPLSLRVTSLVPCRHNPLCHRVTQIRPLKKPRTRPRRDQGERGQRCTAGRRDNRRPQRLMPLARLALPWLKTSPEECLPEPSSSGSSTRWGRRPASNGCAPATRNGASAAITRATSPGCWNGTPAGRSRPTSRLGGPDTPLWTIRRRRRRSLPAGMTISRRCNEGGSRCRETTA
jgi:hypothetical protein